MPVSHSLPIETNLPCLHVDLVLQPMNVLRHGSQAVQHSQTMVPPSNSSGPMSGAANINDAVSGKMGKPLT